MQSEIETRLRERGVNVDNLIQAIQQFKVETPSWGYGNSGTRFKVFPWPGAARNLREKLEDAALVQKLVGICPSVAIHIPWDQVDDWEEIKVYAAQLGLRLGSVNPNLFQDNAYRFGSLCHCTEASFSGLFLQDVLPLIEREDMSDRAMVAYLAHCFFEPGRPRPSIETLLHAFLPFAHIDHTHADASNYFACAENGEALARDCFGAELIWIPYRRPGFGLAREVALEVRAHPGAKLVILAKHGLITWGDTDADCFAETLATVAQARDFVEARLTRSEHAVFGGPRVASLPAHERRTLAAQIAPVLRGLVSTEQRQILQFTDSEDVLNFASSQDAPRLTTVGAACPDHLVHTKPWPLLVEWTPEQDSKALNAALRGGVGDWRGWRHWLSYLPTPGAGWRTCDCQRYRSHWSRTTCCFPAATIWQWTSCCCTYGCH